MKNIRKNSLILAIILLLFFPACGHQKTEYISVTSTDYVNINRLKAGVLSEAIFQEEDPYPAYYCYVSKTNTYGDQAERLVVNNERGTHVHICYGNTGYFVGFDYSEYASGLAFFPYSGSSPIPQDTDLPTGRCVAILDSTAYSQDHYYAVTSWNYYDLEDQAISVYLLQFLPDDDPRPYEIVKICDVAEEDAVAACRSDPDTIYVITNNSLYQVGVDGSVTSLEVPDEWWDLRVNSIVHIGGSLYIGTKFGSLVYHISEGYFSWFPVDYGEIVPE